MIVDRMIVEAPSKALRRTAAKSETKIRVVALAWHRVALGLILLLTAAMNFWQLDRVGYGNTYYAAAVKSMIQSWHNFYFVAFDPGGFVTIDKPPLGSWLQAISARILGYSGFSLLLPEALAAVGSVAVIYHLIRGKFGIPASLLAALFLALTPVLVAVSRSNIIDGTLVFFMLLGAWAVTRAVDTGKARWLMLCAVFVGLGFNVKMLEAFLVVPAFGLMYLLGSRLRWRTRLLHLFLAAILLLTVSLSWAVSVDLTPASQRPWVDSTSTNSEVDLALGYNGLQRLLGQTHGSQNSGQLSMASVSLKNAASAGGTTGSTSTSATTVKSAVTSGSTTNTSTSTVKSVAANGVTVTSAVTSTGTISQTTTTQTAATTERQSAASSGGGGAGGLFNNGAAGPLRLFDTELGGQASWLLALALIGLVAMARGRPRFPLDERQRAVVLWAGWLFTAGAFFSVAGFFHSYYLVTLAPPIAALAAVAVITLWRDYLHPTGARWHGWALPAALLVAAGAQAYMLSAYPAWSRWLTPAIAGLTLAVAVWLVAARVRSRLRRGIWVGVMVAGSMLALLLAPTAWAFDTISNGDGGLTPAAGPTSSMNGGGGMAPSGFTGFQGQGTGAPPTGAGAPPAASAGGPPTFSAGGSATTSAVEQRGGQGMSNGGGGQDASVNKQLLAYLEKQQGTTKYLVAVSRSTEAAPYIIQTGKAVMSLGGFSGSNPILTTAQLETLIKTNVVRFFLTGGNGNSTTLTYVQSACKAVPASTYQSATTSSASGAASTIGGGSSSQLYDCGNLIATSK